MGESCLHAGCKYGHAAVVEYLVSIHTNIDLQDAVSFVLFFILFCFLYSVLSLIVVFSMHHCVYLPSINIFMIFIMIYHANYFDHVDHHYHHDLVIMIIITIIIKRVVIISTSSTKSPASTSQPGMDSRELLRFNVG